MFSGTRVVCGKAQRGAELRRTAKRGSIGPLTLRRQFRAFYLDTCNTTVTTTPAIAISPTHTTADACTPVTTDVAASVIL